MAGRPRRIDRDRVLDAAEAVVTRMGAARLTIDAVARAAGVTKGGVQYCFGTKENLIRAMIARWSDAFDAEVAGLAGPDPSARAIIRAHLEATRADDETDHSRSAAMMTALLEAPDQVAASRDWYDARITPLDLTDPADRKAAIAFLACEGAFLLRSFGLMGLDEAQWNSLFGEMLAMASDPPARK